MSINGIRRCSSKMRKILWDMKFQTEKVIEIRDWISLFSTMKISFVTLLTSFVSLTLKQLAKEKKHGGYTQLKYETKIFWNCHKVVIISIVIGASRKRLENFIH